MESIIAAAFAAVVALAGSGAWAQSAEAPMAQSVQVGGASREYLLVAPTAIERPVPLVIALHGGGGNAKTMTPRWLDTARREGFAVAFPSGAGRSANMGTWNAEGCCGYAMTSGSDDIAFIAAMIDDISRTHRIDPARIYVTGLSNGGMLTYRIGAALAPRIAAIAVVSGAMFGGEPAPSTPLPVLIMHGAQDDIVPFKGGTSPMALVARSQSRPFREVSYAVDFWRRADGCAEPPSVEVQGDVTVESYGKCLKGGEVVFYRLNSAGHTWPGPVAANGGLERAHYDQIDATEVIWRFFSRHAR
jgi:polyhydroxybutyrate depolymerase